MIYKSDTGNTAIVIFTGNNVTFCVDDQSPITLSFLGTMGGFYNFGNVGAQGGLAFTANLRTMYLVFFNYGKMEFKYVSGSSLFNPNNNYEYQPQRPQNNQSKEVTCSYCNGKGWVIGNSTPTYGNMGTKWCDECHDYFVRSHSHDRCPSCMGRGVIKK